MANHQQRMDAETNAERKGQLGQKLGLWKKSLTDVANVAGFDVNGRREAEIIEEVIKNIRNLLDVPLKGPSSSLSTYDQIYDVYLSYRGTDNGYNFIDQLHKALLDANINVIKDSDVIQKGKELKPQLEIAIKASRASIIMLSKDYAFSTWCLDELVLILEQRRNSDHIVLPIFYNVDPTDVRKQQKSVAVAMENHQQRMDAETNAERKSQLGQKMGLWRESLTDVANVAGCDVNGRRETEIIEEVVEKIRNLLGVPLKGSSSPSSTYDPIYDVFLSFRVTDTRYNFTDHLHKALLDANMKVFLDDDVIQTAEELKPELESAIKASRTSIIVLSKGYASSTWCLDELVLILEQSRKRDHIVLPILYNVDPTDVRKPHRSFAVAMERHKQRMDAETNAERKSQLGQKLWLWKKSLTDVVNLKGFDANGRLETEIIEEVVENIRNALGVPLGSTFPDLFGVDNHISFISSWLKDGSTGILTISGMSGIGKTSLAKYVYGLHRREFKRSSFIDDINRKCEQQCNKNKLLDLQKQLYDDMLKIDSYQAHHDSAYTSLIENALSSKKVFLVLDDIDSLDQLDALLGNKGNFHPGSKIIITTKDTSLVERCKLFNQKVLPKVLLEPLNEASSHKLLCFHAFKSIRPKEGYKRVSKRLVRFCEGLPLALKVLGRSLYDQDVAEWEECVQRLNQEADSSVGKIMRMSFDSLPSQNDKELFKYIACFFVRMDKDYTETILKACGIRTILGIRNLVDRCLVTIGPSNKLMMHQLLQDMGRDVVHQESRGKPWKRSRLWCHEDSFQVLKQEKGKRSLKGVILDMRMVDKEKLDGSVELKTEALSKMDNLMLLKLNYVQLGGPYKNFPHNLRWLCMHQFPLDYIPSDLPMENLVALDLSYSTFESFDLPRFGKMQKLTGSSSKDKRLLGSLKILNLSFCIWLCSIGGFVELPALERLIVTNCIRLTEVSESIEECVKLVSIDVSHCNNFQKLPRSVWKLSKLQVLLLDGCRFMESESFSSALVKPINDPPFLPTSLVSLSLANNNLFNNSFPMDFSFLSSLKELCLDGNPIISLPHCVRSLRRLETLSMKDCSMLTSIEYPPPTLRQFIIGTFSLQDKLHKSLRKIVFDPEMSPLKLSVHPFSLAPSSFEIEGIVKIQPIAEVEGKLLHSLGWSNLETRQKRSMITCDSDRGLEITQIQMYYEFGIFSTIYGAEVMPSWITHSSKGPSVSFTIPSSPNKLKGLNFCYVITYQDHDQHSCLKLSKIRVYNKTKKRTFIYNHYIDSVNVGEERLIFLSHWMFGKNEIEEDDHVVITATEHPGQPGVRECGVSFVYDDRNIDKEDPLSYYKSWNHIIGGDLVAFQVKTGECILDNSILFQDYNVSRPSVTDNANCKEDQAWFKAFSQRKPGVLGSAPEDVHD